MYEKVFKDCIIFYAHARQHDYASTNTSGGQQHTAWGKDLKGKGQGKNRLLIDDIKVVED